MCKPAWATAMPLTTHIEDRWVDIVPPDVPLTSAEPLTIVVCAMLLVALLAIGFFFYRRPRQRARRVLRRLARDLHRSRLDGKPACFRIRQCLREGFGQRRLSAVPLPPASQHDWQRYLDKLAQCCFADTSPSVSELDSVIDEALAWLNTKAVET